MDRSLWLLLGLRFKGWLRRYGRNLRSAKGVALTILGLVLFVPWLLSVFLVRQPGGPERLEEVRRTGPWFLLGYCVLTLLLASGERSITFSPAEVNLLFPAPFSRRQLLVYKIAASLGLCLLSAVFMTVFLGGNASSFLAGYVGMALGLQFMQLFSMAVGLVTSSLGAIAVTWRRRAVLALVLLVVAAALWEIGLKEIASLPAPQLISRLEQSFAVRAAIAPFRWFVLIFTAEQIWPDLVQWAALGLLTNAALVAFVLMLDAKYLEASAAASERVYARLERIRRGGVAEPLRSRRTGKARISLPMFPNWHGAGPIAWRQANTALRDIARLISILLVFGVMSSSALMSMNLRHVPPSLPLTLEGIILGITLVITASVPFDFRADLDRMAEIKALPIAPAWMAIGQLLTPVALVTFIQLVALGLIAVFTGRSSPMYWGVASFAVPFNTLLFSVENLMFLWFPARLAPATPGDIQNMGRVFLMMLAKLTLLGIAAGAASIGGGLVYLVTGGNWAATLAMAWLILAGLFVAILPLMAIAYRRFDVARDMPL